MIDLPPAVDLVSDQPKRETFVYNKTTLPYLDADDKKFFSEDKVVNEKSADECTLKTHKQLNWFWRMLSALHACGHACSRFPCMATNDKVDKFNP